MGVSTCEIAIHFYLPLLCCFHIVALCISHYLCYNTSQLHHSLMVLKLQGVVHLVHFARVDPFQLFTCKILSESHMQSIMYAKKYTLIYPTLPDSSSIFYNTSDNSILPIIMLWYQVCRALEFKLEIIASYIFW